MFTKHTYPIVGLVQPSFTFMPTRPFTKEYLLSPQDLFDPFFDSAIANGSVKETDGDFQHSYAEMSFWLGVVIAKEHFEQELPREEVPSYFEGQKFRLLSDINGTSFGRGIILKPGESFTLKRLWFVEGKFYMEFNEHPWSPNLPHVASDCYIHKCHLNLYPPLFNAELFLPA